MGFWGDALDNVTTAVKFLPELGISERLNGGKRTTNTGRVDLNTNMSGTLGSQAYYSAVGRPQTANNPLINGAAGAAPMSISDTYSPNIASYDVNGNVVSGGGGYDAAAAAAAQRLAAARAAANPLLASMGSLDTILANRNAQSQGEYDRAIAGYNDADRADHAAYDKNVQGNENAYTAGNQAALLNAANGAKGLRGVLASIGALGGSGMDIIGKLVGLAANTDQGGARKNFEANADSINTNWSAAEQKQRQRRSDAQATLENNFQNNKAGVLNSRKGIYEQLANIFGTDTAEGQGYAGQASALAPEIAATTRASIAPYAASSELFSPAALQKYLAGTQNLNVDTSGTPQAPINSPLFAQQNEKKKDQLLGVA